MTNIVEFPTGENGLDMEPYAANASSAKYTLYGISNHMGESYFSFGFSFLFWIFLYFIKFAIKKFVFFFILSI